MHPIAEKDKWPACRIDLNRMYRFYLTKTCARDDGKSWSDYTDRCFKWIANFKRRARSPFSVAGSSKFGWIIIYNDLGFLHLGYKKWALVDWRDDLWLMLLSQEKVHAMRIWKENRKKKKKSGGQHQHRFKFNFNLEVVWGWLVDPKNKKIKE